MILLGKKQFHSNKKDQDYFQIIVAYQGDKDCGTWTDNPFISKELYDSIKPENFGKDVKIEYGYAPGSSQPRITGFQFAK